MLCFLTGEQKRVSPAEMEACQVLKIVVKVQIDCAKCKACVMKTIAKLTGIDKIEIDSEKNTVTVTGKVDPVDVVKQVRKVRRTAEIVTVGPPPKKEEKKDNKKEESGTLPVCCARCDYISMGVEEYGWCSIM